MVPSTGPSGSHETSEAPATKQRDAQRKAALKIKGIYPKPSSWFLKQKPYMPYIWMLQILIPWIVSAPFSLPTAAVSCLASRPSSE